MIATNGKNAPGNSFASSVFFANFLPGAAGGDLIRGVYGYKAAPGRRAAAMLSILMDRLIGLIAFVLLGLAAMLTRPIGERPLEFSVLTLSVLFIALLVLHSSTGMSSRKGGSACCGDAARGLRRLSTILARRSGNMRAIGAAPG